MQKITYNYWKQKYQEKWEYQSKSLIFKKNSIPEMENCKKGEEYDKQNNSKKKFFFLIERT